MKLKIMAAIAALALGSSPALAMDCCKDGKCACCAKMGEKDGKPMPKM